MQQQDSMSYNTKISVDTATTAWLVFTNNKQLSDYDTWTNKPTNTYISFINSWLRDRFYTAPETKMQVTV